MTDEAKKVAHVASDAWVRERKEKGEPNYGLCGAPIEGVDATGTDAERCPECRKIYEGITGDDSRVLDDPDHYRKLADDVLRAVSINGVAVRATKTDGGGPATIDIRWSGFEEVHEFPCDGWELVQGVIPGEAEAPGVFVVYAAGVVLAVELAEECEVTVNGSTTRFVDGKPERGEEVSEPTERIALMERALEKIARWHGEFPPTGQFWPDDTPMSYSTCWGSNGERDYMREVARKALAGEAWHE